MEEHIESSPQNIYINNSKLSPVQKLFYLFRKTDGEARDVNRNIALTAENFDIAWNNLKLQYENKRVLINGQLKLLFNLAPCQNESATEIKRIQREINNCMAILKLYNIDIKSWEINNCMAILKLYNIDIKSWDPIFVFQCSSRLSETSLNLWEQSVKNKTDNFMSDRFHALESVSDIIATNFIVSSGSQTTNQTCTNQTSVKVKQFKAHHIKVDSLQCKLCKENHKISSCNKFLNMNYKARVSTLKKFRFCFNCLTIGHMYGDCNTPNNCSKCTRKHHTLMHREFVRKNIQSQTNTSQNDNQNSQNNASKVQSTNVAGPSGVVQSHHTLVSKKVMLATAWVNIISHGSYYKARALIDPCSAESFISEKIQKLLNSPVSAEITGLGGDVIKALVVSRVTGNVPTQSFNHIKKNELPNLNYADPKFFESDQIDLLLEGDLYPLIIRGGVKHGIFDSLVAQETIFGWIVTGPTPNNVSPRIMQMSFMTKVCISNQLAKFWELEEVSHRKILSEEDKKCEEIYRSTTTRNSEGRYFVGQVLGIRGSFS
ncbi:uncharacterized protein LOC119603392 [Lucilia sericata]|uniref:uncharacterized protein LOC119603392 n=1 Tax=Lucilia sericata TaxID=13632 RepID=UPI0018A85EDC|nr:uncharacterized protein LOC119603392 [Lucilia sericata]